MAGPRWVRLDVDYFRNPKTLAAGREGRALHLASICHAGAALTDGLISREALRVLLAEAEVPRRVIDRVVEAGLWVPDGAGTYVVHDFTETNGTRKEVLAKIAAETARKAEWRARRSGARDRQT